MTKLALIRKYKNSTKVFSQKLVEALDLEVFSEKSKPISQDKYLFINWGRSKIPWLDENAEILNHPSSVKMCVNKLCAFRDFQIYGVSHPPFTTSKEEAIKWIEQGEKVVCRTILEGSKGNGIIIAKTPEEVVDCKLYVKYIQKKWELRVHVFKGNIIDVRQKRKLSKEKLEERGITSTSKYIRNMANGYIFSVNIDDELNDIKDKIELESTDAVDSLDLDFGAVDLIITKDKDVYVLEVNSSPALVGSTVDKYIKAIKELI